ncbi:cyclic nucleotide-binding domain-containing protein, partial [Pseudoduganella sp. RAF53_2]
AVIFGFLKSNDLSPLEKQLHRSPLFASLTPRELKTVYGLVHERRYLADEIVFDEGEEGQALYLVLAGRVRINKARENGYEPVAELEPGAYFGDMALLDNTPRSAQARAIGDCELAVFFRADFIALMETDAVVGYKIALALARHLGRRLRNFMGDRPQIELM